MTAPHRLNQKREFVWTVVALVALALGLLAVTWLAQRPAAVVSTLRKSGWVVWLVVAVAAAWRLNRRRRMADEGASATSPSTQHL
jgi:hypothetical protein